MSLRYYANAPATALAASCSNSATSINVNSVTGFPIQYPYTLILDRGTASEEAVSVTAASGTTLTVTRAIDSTTAFAHSIGATVEHGVTAQDVREPNAHINANTAVHGLAGAVVGTTDAQALTNKDLSGAGNTFPTSLATLTGAQTLTNKTIALGSNTVSGTRAQFNTAMTDDDFASLTGTETLTNKTLTSPKVGSDILDTNGNKLIGTSATASAVNYLQTVNSATTVAPQVAAQGTDTNVSLNLVPKGTGRVQANAVNIPTVSSTDTLTNKTLDTGTKIGTSGTDLSGAMTSYTPTITNLTLGNGTLVARYHLAGKMLKYRLDLVGGSTTSASGALSVPLPGGMTAHASGLQALHTRHFDGSTVKLGGSFISASGTSIALQNTSAITIFNNGHEVTLYGEIELA